MDTCGGHPTTSVVIQVERVNNIFSVVALDNADNRDGAVAAGITTLILVVVITSIVLVICILK